MKGPTALKIIAGAAVAMLVLGGGISLWIDAVASRRMQEMEREVRSLHDRMQGPDSSRSPRPGTAVPGNAWDDYNKALAAVQANRGALEPVNAFVFRHPDADREKAVGVVAAHAATI